MSRKHPTVPVERFNDRDIVSGDHDSWAANRVRLDPKAVERWKGRISKYGQRWPVEVVTIGDGLPRVSNGHHRVEAVRQLGLSAVSIRWSLPKGFRWEVQDGVPPEPDGAPSSYSA